MVCARRAIILLAPASIAIRVPNYAGHFLVRCRAANFPVFALLGWTVARSNPACEEFSRDETLQGDDCNALSFSRVAKPLLQPQRRVPKPIRQSQEIDQQCGPQNAVPDVTAAGDRERRFQHDEPSCLLNSPYQLHVLKERPVRRAADCLKNAFAHEDALIAGG